MADWISNKEKGSSIRSKLNGLKSFIENLKTTYDSTFNNMFSSIGILGTSDIKLSQNIASKTGLKTTETIDDVLIYMIQMTKYDNINLI